MNSGAGTRLAGALAQPHQPFKQKFPGANLEVLNVPGANGYFGVYIDKVQSLIAGGTGPDLYTVPDFDFLTHWAARRRCCKTFCCMIPSL